MWVDDRLRVCKFIHEAGLPLFRVGDPEANFLIEEGVMDLL